MKILFIGNSHTYFNDLPDLAARLAADSGVQISVTMIAHGGWYLAQHVEEPDVRFNILHGHYDYVVLQEHTHPFGPVEKYDRAVKVLADWCREAGSMPVIYMTWAKKDSPEDQALLTEAHRNAAKETGALLAPVGEKWWKYREENPDVEMYAEDGAHASPAGSAFAAKVIWEVISQDAGQRAIPSAGFVPGHAKGFRPEAAGLCGRPGSSPDNILSGKKWVACGDSFTHGDFTGLEDSSCRIKEGRYRGLYRVYPYLIGNRNNMAIVNTGVNGATIADYPPNDDLHTFVRGAYREIPADADYITLRFGINDWHKDIPIGTPDDTDPHTFYGAWNIVLPYLIEHHPYAKIGIIITNGTMPEYTEPQRVMAAKWGVPYLDMQKDPLVSLMHRVHERPGICEEALNLRMKAFAVSETNRHPNPRAHEYESTFIEHFLRSL